MFGPGVLCRPPTLVYTQLMILVICTDSFTRSTVRWVLLVFVQLFLLLLELLSMYLGPTVVQTCTKLGR